MVLTCTTLAISILWFRHLDLTFEYFAHLIIVPVCQASVVAAASSSFRDLALRPMIRDAATHSLTIPVLVMDAGLLSSGWLLKSDPVWGIAGAASVHGAWIGTKTMAASMFFLRDAMRSRMTPLERANEWRASERAQLLGFAGLLLAAGSSAFVPWLVRLPELISAALPLVLRWLAVYGVLFAAALILAIRAADVLRRRNRTAAFLLDTATAAALASAILLVLNGYQRRYLLDAWLGAVRTLASVGSTLVLMAGILAAAPGPDRHRGQ
jgi:hypothetical protein